MPDPGNAVPPWSSNWDLITRTLESLLRLEQSRRCLRAEWHITLLIVVETLLTLYERFIHR